MSKPKTVREILEEPFKDGWHKTIDRKEAALKELMMGVVPEEATLETFDQSDKRLWGDGYTNVIRCRMDGFNISRTEVLTKIEGMF